MNPALFYTVGSEELFVYPSVTNPSPSSDTLGVSLNPVLSIHVMNLKGNPMNVQFMTNASGSWQVIGSNLSVGNGTYSQQTTVFTSYSTWYWWGVNDGGYWTNTTYRFCTGGVPGLWWNNSWLYRKSIIIDHTRVTVELSNFPMLIDVTDTDFIGKVQSDGDDFVFTTFDGVKLNHEIELYNASSGHLIAWVNVTSLSSTVDTVLYLYYGNAVCGSQENKVGIWDAHYRMVQHLKETSGTHYDSTVYGNNGVPQNGTIQGTTGKIDGADWFDGTNDYVDVGNVGATADWTVSFWAKSDDVARVAIYPIGLTTNKGIGMGGTHFTIANDFYIYDGTTTIHGGPSVKVGAWYYITVVKNGGSYSVYVNATPVVTGSLIDIDLSDLNIGQRSDNMLWFKGTLDEVQISDIPRSAGWLSTTYNNQMNPGAFSVLGNEEQMLPIWNVTMRFTASGDLNDYVVFGESSDASDGQDGYDVPKPSVPSSPYIYAWFSTNLSEPYDTLWVDYQRYPGTSKVWDLYVLFTDSIAKTITIQWDPVPLQNSEYTVVTLRDVDFSLNTSMLTNNSYTYLATPSTVHHFMIICTTVPLEYVHIVPLKPQWNLVSLPISPPYSKAKIIVSYLGVNYTWQQAVNNSIVLASVYGWNATVQNYLLTETMQPGHGYWMYAYSACELRVLTNKSNIDNNITALRVYWNLVGSPFDTPVTKANIIVFYNSTEYTWPQAVNNSIVLASIYGWNATLQNYQLVDILHPGDGYWLYAYYVCVLKKKVI
jgi:hypothetical protein